MYQIQAHRQEGQTTLLIPAMLDDHFPLLQYAFHSRETFPVILDQGQGAAELGLRYAHNDMCYPFHLSLGQYLLALGSGAYDLENTALLMPTVGDACRGSNFTSLIRKALVQAGVSPGEGPHPERQGAGEGPGPAHPPPHGVAGPLRPVLRGPAPPPHPPDPALGGRPRGGGGLPGPMDQPGWRRS